MSCLRAVEQALGFKRDFRSKPGQHNWPSQASLKPYVLSPCWNGLSGGPVLKGAVVVQRSGRCTSLRRSRSCNVRASDETPQPSFADDAGPTGLRKQLAALQEELEDTQERANQMRTRFLRLTKAVEELTVQAGKAVQNGDEAAARQNLLEKRKIMIAITKVQSRAEILERLAVKLRQAVSQKETQLIAAVYSGVGVSAVDTPARIVGPQVPAAGSPARDSGDSRSRAEPAAASSSTWAAEKEEALRGASDEALSKYFLGIEKKNLESLFALSDPPAAAAERVGPAGQGGADAGEGGGGGGSGGGTSAFQEGAEKYLVEVDMEIQELERRLQQRYRERDLRFKQEERVGVEGAIQKLENALQGFNSLRRRILQRMGRDPSEAGSVETPTPAPRDPQPAVLGAVVSLREGDEQSAAALLSDWLAAGGRSVSGRAFTGETWGGLARGFPDAALSPEEKARLYLAYLKHEILPHACPHLSPHQLELLFELQPSEQQHRKSRLESVQEFLGLSAQDVLEIQGCVLRAVLLDLALASDHELRQQRSQKAILLRDQLGFCEGLDVSLFQEAAEAASKVKETASSLCRLSSSAYVDPGNIIRPDDYRRLAKALAGHHLSQAEIVAAIAAGARRELGGAFASVRTDISYGDHYRLESALKMAELAAVPMMRAVTDPARPWVRSSTMNLDEDGQAGPGPPGTSAATAAAAAGAAARMPSQLRPSLSPIVSFLLSFAGTGGEHGALPASSLPRRPAAAGGAPWGGGEGRPAELRVETSTLLGLLRPAALGPSEAQELFAVYCGARLGRGSAEERGAVLRLAGVLADMLGLAAAERARVLRAYAPEIYGGAVSKVLKLGRIRSEDLAGLRALRRSLQMSTDEAGHFERDAVAKVVGEVCRRLLDRRNRGGDVSAADIRELAELCEGLAVSEVAERVDYWDRMRLFRRAVQVCLEGHDGPPKAPATMVQQGKATLAALQRAFSLPAAEADAALGAAAASSAAAALLQSRVSLRRGELNLVSKDLRQLALALGLHPRPKALAPVGGESASECQELFLLYKRYYHNTSATNRTTVDPASGIKEPNCSALLASLVAQYLGL